MGASIVSAAVILSVVYFGSMRLLEAQTSSVVEAELSNLVDDYAVGGNRALLSAISNRTNNIQNPDSIYLLARNDGSAVAGNLSRWPGVTPNGEWQTVDLFRTDIAENVAVGGGHLHLREVDCFSLVGT